MGKFFKTAGIVVVVIVLLFGSLIAFPIYAGAIAWDGGFINIANFVVSSIFLAVWVAVLLVAAKIKSKILFGMHVFYWLFSAISCLTTLLMFTDVYHEIIFLLFIAAVTPIAGILYPLELIGFNIPNAVIFLFPVFVSGSMLISGIFIGRRRKIVFK